VRPTDEKSSVERARPDALHRRSRAGAIRTMSSRVARRGDQTQGESQCDRSMRNSSGKTARPDARHRRSRASAIRTTSSRAARRSDRTHGESQCDRPTRNRAARWRVRMHGIGAVEMVQFGRRVVAPRDIVTGRTARASATDRREVERRDGASRCTA
jgi:hypothetical protein